MREIIGTEEIFNVLRLCFMIAFLFVAVAASLDNKKERFKCPYRLSEMLLAGVLTNTSALMAEKMSGMMGEIVGLSVLVSLIIWIIALLRLIFCPEVEPSSKH